MNRPKPSAYIHAKKVFMVPIEWTPIREVDILNRDFNQTMSLEKTIELYSTVGHRNADFLFHWISSVYDYFYLPSINLDYKDALILDKTKLTIFDVLVDDLADNAEIRDKKILEKAVKIPWNGIKTYKNNYLDVTRKIWLDCIDSIRHYPRFKEFEDLFYFDLDKTLYSMKYSYLANQMGINNQLEDEMYIPHGCMAILHADMDLMCSPDFDKDELKKLRPILHWVENVVHIGNVMNTYAREVEEADFSSPMISLALNKGLIDKRTVVNDPKYAIAKLEHLIPYFKEKVEDNFQKIEYNADTIKSIDMNDYSQKLRRVWEEFLERKQYWKTTMVKEEKALKPNILQRMVAPTIQWIRI